MAMTGGGVIRTIGFMSGTSLDGVDAAGLDTDGQSLIEIGPTAFVPYTDAERVVLKGALTAAAELTERSDEIPSLQQASEVVTDAHGRALDALRSSDPTWCDQAALIGFHGQTVVHRPDLGFTYQIGDAKRLAVKSDIPVVTDLRLGDLVAGGQGAPLVPIYHRGLMDLLDLEDGTVFVNIGGVSNITYRDADTLLAFDTGPGNALLDDWVRSHGAGPYDEGGRIASSGVVDQCALDACLAHSYFAEAVPKSLDRDAFSLVLIEGLSLKDGAATLAAFTARSIALAERHFPKEARRWVLFGGGRKNSSIVDGLADKVSGAVVIAEDLIADVPGLHLDGDFVEAQAFGYLAARSLHNLPLTFPATTGASAPTTGGRLIKPSQ